MAHRGWAYVCDGCDVGVGSEFCGSVGVHVVEVIVNVNLELRGAFLGVRTFRVGGESSAVNCSRVESFEAAFP